MNRPSPDIGPFRANHLRDGDRYELSNGHPLYCAPSGPDHAAANSTGAALLDSDPDVEWTGIDAGYAPEPGTLRAPDVSVAPPQSGSGWISGVPLLALEYAGRGQDEAELRAKIADLLEHGTRLVWVVRLVGPRRVEVHAPGRPTQTRGVGDLLEAPGILRNPVPVTALFERAAAQDLMLRNLLERRGYAGLDEVRAEGLVEAIVAVLEARGLVADEAIRTRLRGTRDIQRLRTWLLAAARVESGSELLAEATEPTLERQPQA